MSGTDTACCARRGSAFRPRHRVRFCRPTDLLGGGRGTLGKIVFREPDNCRNVRLTHAETGTDTDRLRHTDTDRLRHTDTHAHRPRAGQALIWLHRERRLCACWTTPVSYTHLRAHETEADL
eukprot:3079599-Rhodomonas_salina.1